MKLSKGRIESLDWLRGLMALSIMFYHLTTWLITPLDCSGFLGRMGIYGVSIFFILSGLSMSIVYHSFMKTIGDAGRFMVRRIFRIWPLMWVACSLVVIIDISKTGSFDIWLFFINITTLFGFISPGDYIATGAWSIGNEMVYYALTPLFFYAFNKRKLYGNILFLITVGVGMLFAFYFLSTSKTLAMQWSAYINPFNNLFLYVTGIAIYYNLKDIHINQWFNISVFIVCVLLMWLLPYSGDLIHIVSGSGRVVFVIISVIIVINFYKFSSGLPGLIAKPLEWFGLATYGVYLLHPVIKSYLGFILTKTGFYNNTLLIIGTIVLTILISLLSYYIFELRMIGLGKKLTTKKKIDTILKA